MLSEVNNAMPRRHFALFVSVQTIQAIHKTETVEESNFQEEPVVSYTPTREQKYDLVYHEM